MKEKAKQKHSRPIRVQMQMVCLDYKPVGERFGRIVV